MAIDACIDTALELLENPLSGTPAWQWALEDAAKPVAQFWAEMGPTLITTKQPKYIEELVEKITMFEWTLAKYESQQTAEQIGGGK